MSRDSAPNLDRFLQRLHRRVVVLRVLEKIGIGIAMASLLGLPLIAVISLRQGAPMIPTTAVIGLGAMGGLFWGISRRPTPMQSAIEADRQLPWADLLSTALSLPPSADNAFASAVLLEANRRCANLSPGSLLLAKIAPRVWGGITLLVMIVFTLAAWVGSPVASQAMTQTQPGDNQTLTASDHGDDPILSPLASTSASSPIRRNVAPADGQDAPPGQSQETSANGDQLSSAANDADRGNEKGQPGGGAGDALGRTNVPSNNTPGHATPSNVPSDSQNARSAGSIGAVGSGSAQHQNTGGNRVEGTGVVTGPRAASKSPPWENARWPADVQSAGEAVNSGQVPAADRDMVRDYFRRD